MRKSRWAKGLRSPGLDFNGSGISDWNWVISFTLIRSARPSLLPPSHLLRLLHRIRLLPRATLHLRWARPGKLVVSPVKTLRSSLMERSVVQQTRSSSRMSSAEKPMEACVWCMALAFAVVVRVPSVNNASGRVAPPGSLARSACSCIPSQLVRLRCSGEIGAADFIDAPVCNLSTTNASR